MLTVAAAKAEASCEPRRGSKRFFAIGSLQGNICTFGQTMIQARTTEYGSKGLAVVSGQTMVQKWPNNSSSHTLTNPLCARTIY